MSLIKVDQEKLKALAVKKSVIDAQQYLRDTDFYYARFSETGEPVPPEVVSKRKEMRDFIRSNS